jgi:TolA-binding protein
MYKKIIIILLAVLAISVACSPVRTKTPARKQSSSSKIQQEIPDQKVKKEKKTTAAKSSKSKKTKEEIDTKVETKPVATPLDTVTDTKVRKRQFVSTKKRFVDTTEIEYTASAELQTIALQNQFDNAAKHFDKDDYDKACKEMQQFAETFIKGDSLYFESLFLWSECLIVKDEIKKAEKNLREILADKRVPENVLEKTLVRLGQIYCVEGEKSKAEALFKRLRQQFPKSIYIPLANCEAVK